MEIYPETAIITVETEEQAAVIKKRVRNARRELNHDPQFIEFHVGCPSEGAYQSLLRRLQAHEYEGRIDFCFSVRRA